MRRRRRAMGSAAGTHFVSSSSFFCSSSICVRRATAGAQWRVEQRGASWTAGARGRGTGTCLIPRRCACHADARRRDRTPALVRRLRNKVVRVLLIAEHVWRVVHRLLADPLLPELRKLHIVHVVLARHRALVFATTTGSAARGARAHAFANAVANERCSTQRESQTRGPLSHGRRPP